ncbi:9169_t:CDS:2 [Diversispora eburnea]|uniref:9169_t:CDS:1 n=1 Tax=Diversispora eburnea TaxID=1213867 RepID=A0A9N8VDS8_9GLOM|nr:9169_t:CDS:2 [Diversispora eburnea]
MQSELKARYVELKAEKAELKAENIERKAKIAELKAILRLFVSLRFRMQKISILEKYAKEISKEILKEPIIEHRPPFLDRLESDAFFQQHKIIGGARKSAPVS